MTATATPPDRVRPPFDKPIYIRVYARWRGVPTRTIRRELMRLHRMHPDVLLREPSAEGRGGDWMIRSIIHLRKYWPHVDMEAPQMSEVERVTAENAVLKKKIREMERRLAKAEACIDRTLLVTQGLAAKQTSLFDRTPPVAHPSPWDEPEADEDDDIASVMADEIDRHGQGHDIAPQSVGLSTRTRP